MGRFRWFRWLALVAVAALGASMLGGAPASARVRAQSNGISSTEVKVGGIVDSQAPDTGVGAQARFDEENAKGGVNGRKINLVETATDNGDPNQDLAVAKRLVEQDGVAAIVPVQSVVFQGGSYLAQQKIPFFGWGISTQFYKNPYGFGFTGSAVAPSPLKSANASWALSIDAMFRNQGDKNGAKGKAVALIAQENDSGQVGLEAGVAAAKAAGMKVVYQKASLPFPTPPSDYTPFVTQLLASNNGKAPDVIFMVTQAGVVIGLSKALSEAGYTGINTNAALYDPRAAAVSKGMTVYTQFDVPEDTANANMQKVVTALKNALGTKPITQTALAGYFGADMFIQALKKAGKNPTSQKIQQAAAKMTYQIKGVVGPTKYPASFTLASPCATLVQSDGTAYKIVAPYKCYTNISIPGGKPIKY
ncbi:MAG TPA: ABC transporter substrate-binding protein [Acidimicrobiia bacterium]|nr:ABC transporter substrate-binding protein [Acidimicrobiia bacterium]